MWLKSVGINMNNEDYGPCIEGDVASPRKHILWPIIIYKCYTVCMNDNIPYMWVMGK